MPPWVSPLKDAIQYVVSKTDKTYKLEVKYINAVKGRGLFAVSSICKGEFVVEYRGDLINDAETQRRRSLYHPSCAAFMFAFKWRGKMWCIDASRDDGSFGRLVNDDHRHPNCKMKKIDVNATPHLCLFALNDIKEGQEITYDYGGDDCPWRTQATTSTVNTESADEPHLSPQSDSKEDDLPGPSSTLQKTTTSTVNTGLADEPHLSPQSDAEEDDLPGPSSTLQKTTTSTVNTGLADEPHLSPQSDSEEDDLPGPSSTLQKEGSCSSAEDEPADETLPPTERNEMTPPPKRFKPLSSDDNVASGVTSSSKGKSTQKKKTPWQQTEVQAVERHMKRFITSCTVPGKSDCEKCLHAEPEALQNRDWKNLKFYVYNRIAAYKKSIQHK